MNREAKRVSNAIAKNTGRKFCTNCQRVKSTDGGKQIRNRYGVRWFCATCFEHRKSRPKNYIPSNREQLTKNTQARHKLEAMKDEKQ